VKPSLRVVVWIGGVAIALAILVPFFLSGRPRQAGPAGLDGTVAAVLPMRDDRGRSVSLSDYRGKIVVMNLWATWCPPCRAEMPDLSRLAAAYAPSGVVVLGVDQGESPQRAAAFARSLRIGYPIWIDDEQRYGRIFTALGLPTTVFIGRDGVIATGFDGALSYEQMRAALKPLVQRS
jgi:thiol-disulfide isomerase/thioredoxin